MNTLAKILPLAPVDDALAVLNRRLGELQARRELIIQMIILAEKSGGGTVDYLSSSLAQAEALLDGKGFVPSREKPLSELAALHAELNLIDAALKLGRSRQHDLVTERAVAIWGSYHSEIAKIEMRRVKLSLELQATNRARERLREKITASGGAGNLSTDGVDLLGLGEGFDDIQWAAARLIADGIATRGEMEKATNG